MPVDEYADEVLTILLNEPGATEILVERVKPLRFAEAEGTYREHMQRLSKLSAHERGAK